MKATRLFAAFVLIASAATAQPFAGGPEIERIGSVRVLRTADPARPIFQAVEEDCNLNLLLCGEVYRGSLTSRDCQGEEGTFFDIHFFPGHRGYIAAAAASSDQFAPLLAMYTPTPTFWDFDFGDPGDVVSVGSYLHTTGNWGLTIGSRSTAATKTGDYLMVLGCNSGKCKPDSTTLCLGGGRYRVQVGYENQFAGRYGFGGALPIAKSSESGYFYFGSDPSNIELLVKVLDFGGGTVKVFWGQLTDLKYKIVVYDTVTGNSKTYLSPSNNCGGTDDDAAFDKHVASTRWAACRSGKNTACLLKNRFQVTGTWRNQYDGSSGELGATRVSDLTSAFYFGSPGNVELLVKMVDLGSRYVLFYGAMSNLEYSLTVTDTATGEQKTYNNPAGRYCGGQDNFSK